MIPGFLRIAIGFGTLFSSMLVAACCADEPPRIVIQSGHTSKVSCIAWSSDGSLLASGSDDNTVRIWHARSRKLIRVITLENKEVRGVSNAVHSIDFSSDAKSIVVGTSSGSAVFNTSTGALLFKLDEDGFFVQSVQFGNESSTIVTAGCGKVETAAQPFVHVWSLNPFPVGPKEISVPARHSCEVVCFNPDASQIVVGNDDREIYVCEIDTGKLSPVRFPTHPSGIGDLCWSHEKDEFFSACQNQVRRWNAKTGKLLGSMIDHVSKPNCIALSPDGKFLATGASDHVVRIWDRASGKIKRYLETNKAPVASIRFMSDNNSIQIGLNDGTIKVWGFSEDSVLFEEPSLDELVAISPDGEYLLSGLYEQSGACVHLVEGEAESASRRTIFDGFFSILTTSGDGSFVAGLSRDNRIYLCEKEQWKPTFIAAPFNNVSSLAISNDGSNVFVGTPTGRVAILDVKEGKKIADVGVVLDQSITGLAISPDNNHLFVYGGYQLHMLSAKNGSCQWKLDREYVDIDAFVFDESGKTLAFAGTEDTGLLDIEKLRVRFFDPPKNSGPSGMIDLMPGKKTLLTGSNGTEDVLIRALDSGVVLESINLSNQIDFLGYPAHVTSLASSSHGSAIALGYNNGAIEIANSDGRSFVSSGTIPGVDKFYRVGGLANSRNGRYMAAVAGNDIFLWNLEKGRLQRSLKEHGQSVTQVDINADGSFLLSGSKDGTAKLWDTFSGEVIASLNHPAGVESVSIDPAGRYLITGCSDSKVRLFDFKTKKLMKTISPLDYGKVTQVSFSPDGLRFISADELGFAHIWNTNQLNLSPIKIEGPHTAYAQSIAFSPDGEQYAIGYGNLSHAIYVGNSNNGDVETILDEHKGFVNFVRFSPDGRSVLSGARDQYAKLWDVSTGLSVNFHHSGWVLDGVFLDGGNKFVTYSTDGAVRLWDRENPDIPLAHLVMRPNGNWVVVTENGDIDCGDFDDVEAITWYFSKKPFSPISPAIFIEPCFKPSLFSKLIMSPTAKATKEVGFDFESINREQPKIGIFKNDQFVDQKLLVFRDENDPSLCTVSFAVQAPKSSPAFDIKLFRNKQLVKKFSGQVCSSGEKTDFTVAVQLPISSERQEILFTAHAFNEDRVRSEFAKGKLLVAGSKVPVQRKAYLISFGANHFETSDWNLQYAAKDARIVSQLLARSLADSNEYAKGDIVSVSLTSEAPTAGVAAPSNATKEKLQNVFRLLGEDISSSKREALLRTLPISARHLAKATPKDLVFVFLSSHGHTSSDGRFYLMPQDIGRDLDKSKVAVDKDARKKLFEECISSDQLASWIEPIDAGEFLMAIGTCQSSGAVAPPGYKHGPFGSHGLGQLAYDKQMRILAASQFDKPSFESNCFEHGLLAQSLIVGLNSGLGRGDHKFPVRNWFEFGEAFVEKSFDQIFSDPKFIRTKDTFIDANGDEDSAVKIRFSPTLFDFTTSNAGSKLTIQPR